LTADDKKLTRQINKISRISDWKLRKKRRLFQIKLLYYSVYIFVILMFDIFVVF